MPARLWLDVIQLRRFPGYLELGGTEARAFVMQPLDWLLQSDTIYRHVAQQQRCNPNMVKRRQVRQPWKVIRYFHLL